MKIIEMPFNEKTTTSIEVEEAKYIGDYALRIFFNDGSEKLVDFKPFLTKAIHPSTKKYLQKKIFKNFKITHGNLNWNDYDLIFPISDLYKGHIN